MSTQIKCDVCGKYFELNYPGQTEPDRFFLSVMLDTGGDPWRLCSVSCLCEKAWELRERQPKLSKSKQEPR